MYYDKKKDTILLAIFLVVLGIYSMIYTVELNKYKAQIKELEIKIEQMQNNEAPWLDKAYEKCRKGNSEDFIRDCVAFEIKELRH